mmetsp:Transcript_1641/g.3569  ORF Transcript_1641/g.3569 Transcript_1641/m.3569 type:complete len:280 (+) Transcript_1641:3630-4469(+)
MLAATLSLLSAIDDRTPACAASKPLASAYPASAARRREARRADVVLARLFLRSSLRESANGSESSSKTFLPPLLSILVACGAAAPSSLPTLLTVLVPVLVVVVVPVPSTSSTLDRDRPLHLDSGTRDEYALSSVRRRSATSTKGWLLLLLLLLPLPPPPLPAPGPVSACVTASSLALAPPSALPIDSNAALPPIRDDAAAAARSAPAPVLVLVAAEVPPTGRPTCPSVTSMPSRSAWMDDATRDAVVDSLLVLLVPPVFSALFAVGASSLAWAVAPPRG